VTIGVRRVAIIIAVAVLAAWLVVSFVSWWNTPSIIVAGGYIYGDTGEVVGMWDRWESPRQHFGGR